MARMSAGKKFGVGLLVCLGLFVCVWVVGYVVYATSDGTTSTDPRPVPSVSRSAAP